MSDFEDRCQCPWCGAELSELHGLCLQDGDQTEIECKDCDKPVKVRLNVIYDYQIRRRACEKHTLDVEVKGFTHTYFRCTACHEPYYDWQLANGSIPCLKVGEYEFVGEAIEVANANGLK